jgi:hypothetical protein
MIDKDLLLEFAFWYSETHMYVTDDPIEEDQVDEFIKMKEKK